MKLLERKAAPGEPELLAELNQRTAELIETEAQAAAAVGRARGEVSKAQGRLDEHRRGQVRANAAAWRRRAVELREQAEEAGDSTTIITIHVMGGADGYYTEPKLVFRRNLLTDEAAAADTRAQHLEDRLAAGDLAGESLASLVSQLEPLREPEPVAV
jgi:hypothetical protein